MTPAATHDSSAGEGGFHSTGRTLPHPVEQSVSPRVRPNGLPAPAALERRTPPLSVEAFRYDDQIED